MKKRLFLMLAVIFIIGFTTGCSGGKKGMSFVPTSAANSQTTEKEPSIDMGKLDATMAIADSLMKDTFGSDYTMVYDQNGVFISFWKENVANAVSLAKSGNKEASDIWVQLVDATQRMNTSLNDILEESGLGGIPVTVKFFDESDKTSALLIVVDGKVTYDALK